MKVLISILNFFIISFVSAQKIWSFNDCLNYAREYNLQVLASKLAEQAQESNLKISKKEKLPAVSGYVGNGFSFGKIPDVDYQILGTPPNYTIDTRTYRDYTSTFQNTMSIESSILLYNKGSLKINEKKNELLLQQQKMVTEQIRDNVSLQLVGNYLSVLLNKELLNVSQNSLSTYKEDLERIEKLYSAGSIPLSNLYETRANYANAKQQFEESKIELDRSLMGLAMLLQKDYRTFVIEDMVVSDELYMPLEMVDDIISYSYSTKPEIKSAELMIQASEKDIELAKTALYPSVTGNYSAGTKYIKSFNDSSVDAFLDQWDYNFNQTLSLGVSIPIFNKGISKEKVETSKIQKSINENELDQQRLTLKQSIQSSHFDVVSSYLTYMSSTESVNSTKLSYEFAQKSFDAGRINLYDLNISRNNYFNSQSQTFQAKYTYLFRLKILDFYAGKPLEISANDRIYGRLGSRIGTQPVDDSKVLYENEPSTIKDKVETLPETTIEKKKDAIEPVENKVETLPETTIEKKDTVEPVEGNKVETLPEATIEKEDAIEPVEGNKVETLPETAIEKKKDTKKKEKEVVAPEKPKREQMIEAYRKKLNEGSIEKPMTNEEREALIKERREKLSKGTL